MNTCYHSCRSINAILYHIIIISWLLLMWRLSWLLSSSLLWLLQIEAQPEGFSGSAEQLQLEAKGPKVQAKMCTCGGAAPWSVTLLAISS
jgi:hypothetical protein